MLELFHEFGGFCLVVKNLIIQHGFHVHDVGNGIRFFALVPGQQDIELLQVIGQIALVRFAGGQVVPDFPDQGLEFNRGVGGEGALTRQQQHRDSEDGGKFIFHGLDLELDSF